MVHPNVFVCVYMYVCMYVCVYVCMYVYIYCMCVCVYIYTPIIYRLTQKLFIKIDTQLHVSTMFSHSQKDYN
jgi:hypothetical protein